MKKGFIVTVLAVAVLAAVSRGVYVLTPPTGTDLTGHWATQQNLGGTVVDLKHSRFRLVGTGYWYTDCGPNSPLVASGRVSGRTVSLKLLRSEKEMWEWGVPETNRYFIIPMSEGRLSLGMIDSVDPYVKGNQYTMIDMERLYRD